MKRISKICLFLMLFIIGIANASAASKDYHATAKNANKELKKKYGETAARYCYYTQDGEPAEYYDIIIAVSKNNRYAAGDIATTLASNREIVENWTPTESCPQYAIDETIIKRYLFIPIAETTLYVTDNPTKYYAKEGNTVYKLVTVTPHSADDKEHKMTCSYTMTNLSESIDGSKITVKFNNMNKVYDHNAWDGKVFFQLSDEFLTETDALGDTCPKLKMCYSSAFKSGTGSDLVSVYFSITSSEYKPNECKIISCSNDEDAECDPENSETICPGFKFIQDRDLTDEQKDEQLTAFCSDVLSTFNYSNTCAQKCMNYLENNKKPINVKNPNCGITQRLLDWVMNILNWVKYLVPVLLIVLSILDFIKALAGEKEDEMKKAQKHFVTRLIAAALIFLTPFILEFIFDKMGFVFEGCGITK